VATWLGFPSLLLCNNDYSGYDFIFYGYDGQHTRLLYSSYHLYEFLNDLINDPLTTINGSLPKFFERDDPFYYNTVILVAHSLGAAVSRQALLYVHEDRASWASNTRLILFAPADRGADILDLVSLTLPLAMSRLPLPFLYSRYVVLQDLKPKSEALNELKSSVRAATRNESAEYLLARRAIFGDRDTVVSPGRFLPSEPRYTVLTGHNHKSVCKPTGTFRGPLDIITSCL
jgi:pimeloyl-ACP methyl ester carboxylesterase